LEAAKQPDSSETLANGDNGAAVDDIEDDGPWYLGKAKEEYKRKRGQDTSRPRDDEDPIQVHFLFCYILLCPVLKAFYNSGQGTNATPSKNETAISDPKITLKALCEVDTAVRRRLTNSAKQ
jgi:hypothetical protein